MLGITLGPPAAIRPPATGARVRAAAWRLRLPIAAAGLTVLILGFALSVANWYLAREQRLGTLNFPISCGWSEQSEFTRATSLLHLFEFSAAENGYRGILERNPSCAIAYWGIAMSRLGNPLYVLPGSSDVAVARDAMTAAAAASTATPRERAYLAAAAKLFESSPGRNWLIRESDYAGAMGQIVSAYPQDDEAKIFYALALNLLAAWNGDATGGRAKAAELLLKVFAEQPRHPGIEHYLTYCLGHIGYQPKPFEKEEEAMTTRQRAALIGTALLALCGLGIFLIATSDFRSGSGATDALGGPFALTGQDGRQVTDRDFRGKWVLLYFGYTHCPDICPTTLANLTQLLTLLGPLSARLQPIFVTIDPERDTPAAADEFAKAFDGRILGLSGKPADIAAVAREYRVFYKKAPGPSADEYAMEHSSYIYVIGPDGRYVTLFAAGPDQAPESMASRLRTLLAPAGQNSELQTPKGAGTTLAAYEGQ